MSGLRREWNGSRSGERRGELREDAEVGVERDSFQAADAKRAESPLVLQAAELALDGSASPIKVAPSLRLARDQRMQPGSLPPYGSGLALAGGAAPLCYPALEVGPGECPGPVRADRRVLVAAFDGGEA